MILVEFFDDFDRKKLALIEKDESFLERSCRESREQIISEIGELLPSKFRFIVWGSPLSLVQESTCTVRKCAIEISEKSDSPDNRSVYRVYLRAMKSEVLPETVPVSTCTITSAPSHVQVVNSTSHIGAKTIDRLVENLNEEKKSLEYRLQIAQATVSSLKETPKERPTIGRNPSFTCSNCHFKGHRVTSCHQPPCQGFFECGNSLQHKEHREELRKAEGELKEASRLLKKNKEEIENTKFLGERTKSNFFSIMRSRLQCSNPVKYSNRMLLDNDLQILAAACKHKAPSDGVILEDIILNYKRNAQNEFQFPVINPQDWQSPLITPRPLLDLPPVNNYFSRCNSTQSFGYSPNHVSPSQPFRGRGWQGRLSPRCPIPFQRSPSFDGSGAFQSRKRLNDVQPNYAVVKRCKESPGKTFRMGLMERCPNNPLSTCAPTCSTPKKVVDDVLEVENEEPQELQNTSSADSSLSP